MACELSAIGIDYSESMPVPTLEAPNGAEFNGPILNNDNQWIPESRDEYFSYGQEVPSSFLEVW